MSVHDELAAATARLAVLPNIIRARQEDADRLLANGFTVDTWAARIEQRVSAVEALVRRLEKKVV